MGKLLDMAQQVVDKAWSGWHGAPPPVRQMTSRHTRVGAGKRSFAGGDVDLLTASFLGTGLSINEELRRSLQRLQWRSRKLCMDNDYAKRFLHMVKANVIGPNGINLQAQFVGNDGKPDASDNQLVESAWVGWSKKKHSSVDGKNSWRALQALVIETIARDGEVLVQKIRNRRSKYGIQLRVMECDHMDINHNVPALNGNRIVMGVELDANDKPVAYWLSDNHPGSAMISFQKRRRIPASDILHIFITERPGQVRGIPWMHTAIRRLNMLGGYEEAELVAARVGASKMGFYISPDGDYANADDMGPVGRGSGGPDGTDSNDGGLVQEATPGTFEQLPDGVSFETFDPQHPTTAYAEFTREVLRGAASGLNVAYNTWANDLEGVNFSSIRSGVLDERDQWKVVQAWLAEQLHGDVYDEWLPWQIDFGVLQMLPADKIDSKFMAVTWQPRGWQWVDPLKDTRANADEYLLGTTTLTDIARAKGKDLRDIFQQRRAELDLAEEFGLTVGIVNPQIPPDAEQFNEQKPKN